MELRGSETERKLWEAFAGESKAFCRYLYYAKRAQREGYEQLAALFRETAENERVHAGLWLRALEEIGGTEQNLLAAADGEGQEWRAMYPEMAETARREIREETGLEAELDTAFRQVVTYYPKTGVIKDVIFFLAQPVGGSQHAQETEIADLGWFSFQDARPLVTFATDEEVLLAAEDYLAKI